MWRFSSIEEFASAVGQELGTSDWLTITQAMIDSFADATGDHQWIHIERARAERSPFGTTIAHGFLTLSLIAQLRDQIYDVDGIAARINYGCDKLRFLEPVPSGGRVRLRLLLKALTPSRHGMRVDTGCTIELAGAPRPALVADQITILVPA